MASSEIALFQTSLAFQPYISNYLLTFLPKCPDGTSELQTANNLPPWACFVYSRLLVSGPPWRWHKIPTAYFFSTTLSNTYPHIQTQLVDKSHYFKLHSLSTSILARLIPTLVHSGLFMFHSLEVASAALPFLPVQSSVCFLVPYKVKPRLNLLPVLFSDFIPGISLHALNFSPNMDT